MPDSVAIDVADDLSHDGQAAMGRGRNQQRDGDTRLLLDSHFVGAALARSRDKKRSVRERRHALRDLTKVIYHELGHVGGIEHRDDENSLMASSIRANPGDGLSAIRRLVPRESKPRRRS